MEWIEDSHVPGDLGKGGRFSFKEGKEVGRVPQSMVVRIFFSL